MSDRSIVRRAKLLCLLLAALLVAWTAPPSQANLLVNGDFENPNAGKIQNGYDPKPVGWPTGSAPEGSDVGGWQSADFPLVNIPGTWTTDTGIEISGGPRSTGAYSAYMNNGDSDFAYPPNATVGTVIRMNQATSYVIQPGDSFNLSVWARPLFTFNGDWGEANATMHWVAYAADGADPVDLYAWLDPAKVIAQGYFDLGLGNGNDPALYKNYQTGAISGAGFEGKNIAVQLYNSSGGVDGDPVGGVPAFAGRSWIGFDDVDLSLVPEPGSVLLLGLGSTLAGFLVRRKR